VKHGVLLAPLASNPSARGMASRHVRRNTRVQCLFGARPVDDKPTCATKHEGAVVCSDATGRNLESGGRPMGSSLCLCPSLFSPHCASLWPHHSPSHSPGKLTPHLARHPYERPDGAPLDDGPHPSSRQQHVEPPGTAARQQQPLFFLLPALSRTIFVVSPPGLGPSPPASIVLRVTMR